MAIKQAQNLCIAAWDLENISKVLKSLKFFEILFYSFEILKMLVYYVKHLERSWIVFTKYFEMSWKCLDKPYLFKNWLVL